MTPWALAAVALGLAWWLVPRLIARFIRRRLGGYMHLANRPDPNLPLRLAAPRAVAVVGAGIAGLTAARALANRGYRVCLIEKGSYLGGKLGSWSVELEPGRTVKVSHGFHAFFRHYYNLNRLLEALGVRTGLATIDDYVILSRNGRQQRFRGLPKTPVYNLLGMLRSGAFSLADALRSPGRDCYGVFLEYDEEWTFRTLDQLSYADFVALAHVPHGLSVAFGTFARAFFATADRLSMAELVKAFHFYYLSHDGGLIYDFPTDDYEPWLLEPLQRALTAAGVEIRLNRPISGIERTDAGFVVDGETFARAILATDAASASAIIGGSQGLPPETTSSLGSLRGGQRYAVWRIWIDRDLRPGLPIFVITEKLRLLDSVTAYHRFERSVQADVVQHGGYVLELHSYAVPDEFPDDGVRPALLEDLLEYFPELAGLTIAHEVFQLRADFTAFHVGQFAERPATDVGTVGLYCAGDWVKLPFPAMLLEAACASGLLAANAIFRLDGLREEAVYSVPPRGLMAGLPPPPSRARILGITDSDADRSGRAKRSTLG